MKPKYYTNFNAIILKTIDMLRVYHQKKQDQQIIRIFTYSLKDKLKLLYLQEILQVEMTQWNYNISKVKTTKYYKN